MYFVYIMLTIYQLLQNNFLLVILIIEDNNRAVARERAYNTGCDSQYIHTLPLGKDCVRVSIIDLLDHNAPLLILCGGIATVIDACGAFISWPKRIVMADTKVCY